jgi:hypothetical protein
MVTHCINPTCGVPLHYLRDGRLFQFEVRSRDERNGTASKKVVRQVAHFWLCGTCSSIMTLRFDAATGVTVIPLVPLPQPAIIQGIAVQS